MMVDRSPNRMTNLETELARVEHSLVLARKKDSLRATASYLELRADNIRLLIAVEILTTENKKLQEELEAVKRGQM